MENENLIEIKIKCETCKEPFETLFVVKDGKPYDFCCSIKCYNEYHSIENVRDRKIKSIINWKQLMDI